MSARDDSAAPALAQVVRGLIADHAARHRRTVVPGDWYRLAFADERHAALWASLHPAWADGVDVHYSVPHDALVIDHRGTLNKNLSRHPICPRCRKC